MLLKNFLRKLGVYKIRQEPAFGGYERYCLRWYHPLFILYTIIVFPIGVFMIGVPETVSQIKQSITEYYYWE